MTITRKYKSFLRHMVWIMLAMMSYADVFGVTVIDNPNRKYDLTHSSQILQVERGAVTIDDLIMHPEKYSFQSSGDVKIEMRSERYGYWIRFEIQNLTDQFPYIQVPFYGTDTIMFFEVQDGRLISSDLSGDKLAFNDHKIKSNSSIFPVKSSPGEVFTAYLYISGANMPSLPFFATFSTEIIHQTHRNDLFDGIYFGFILIIILYNLVLFFQVRERDHLVYSLWVITLALQLSIFKGHAETFFWPNSPRVNDFVDSFSSLTGIVHIWFTFVILKMKRFNPGWRKVGLFLMSLYIIVILVNLAGYTNQAYSRINPGNVALLEGIWSITVGVIAFRKGFRPAAYYVIGNVALFASIFVFFFYAFGMLPHSFFTYNSMLIGSGIEVIFFSFALAAKVNIYKKKKEQSERETYLLWQENVRLVREQNVILEKQVKERTHELQQEKNKSDELLLNILPEETAEELKQSGKSMARRYDPVTIMFTDFKGFTNIAETMTPEDLVQEINECFTEFDKIMEKHGIEKIKTIGDAYMAVAGLPVPMEDHATMMVRAALDICRFMEEWKKLKKAQGKPVFEVRVGIHTGQVVAGIVGFKKFAYDIWGDAVNLAARMESGGEPNKINISQTTYELVKDQFHCVQRGKFQVKGKGEVEMYFVEKEISAVNLTEETR